MALGRQFENTYWHDDKGETRASILNPTGETSGPERYKIDRRLTGAEADTQATKHSAQGMLFSPETGTGMREDPLVPHATRIAAIQKGMGMDDPVKYAERAGKVKRTASMGGNSRAPLNPRAAKTATDLYTNALDTSTMPTHIIQKHIAEDPVLAVVNTDMSRGHITGRGGVIRLPVERRNTYERIPEHTITRTVGGDTTEPVNNPKLTTQAGKVKWEQYGSDNHIDDVLKHATITGPKGEQFMRADYRRYVEDKTIRNPDYRYSYEPHHDPNMPREIPNPKYREPFKFKVAPQAQQQREADSKLDLDFTNLPEGYSMNVYPGKGKVTDPNIKTKDFAVYKGRHPVNYTMLEATWHTRDRVSNPVTEEVTVPSRVVTKVGEPKLNRNTVVHELGHHLDQNLNDRFNQRNTSGASDPAEEAVADAIADVHSRYSEYSDRLFTEGGAGYFHKRSGYRTGYSGFTNNTDRAMYSAMRAHASANPDPAVFNQTPSRSALVQERSPKTTQGWSAGMAKEDRNVANQLLLGHLYDSHEHVRKTLAESGFEKEGRAARKAYQDRDPNKPVQHHQPQLPGFEV